MSDQRDNGGESDVARRQAALRALAQSQTHQPAGAVNTPAVTTPTTPTADPAREPRTARTSTFAGLVSAPRRQRRRGRALAIAALALLVVVVAALGSLYVLHGRQGGASTALKPVVTINPATAGLPCITQAAWSPDGARFAAVGDTEGCGISSGGAQSDAIFIFDARSGKTLAELRPDAPLYAAPDVQTAIGPTANPQYTSLFYNSVAWARAGKARLLTFNLFTPNQQGNNFSQVFGLLRLGVSQQSLNEVLVAPSTIPGNTLLRFDLTSGAAMAVPAPVTATAYRWSDSSALVPASAAGGPIGNPVGDATFSIWQPGDVQYGGQRPAPNAQTVAVPQDIEWAANFLAVSPDGRYCYLNVQGFGRLVPPSTKQSDSGESSFAPRDAALLALAQQMTLAQNPNANARLLLAWRPDGKLLAEVSDNRNGGGQAPTTISVALFDTATGKVVKRLTPDFGGLLTSNAENLALVWSPDGKRLLLLDDVHGVLTIWGPGALPA